MVLFFGVGVALAEDVPPAEAPAAPAIEPYTDGFLAVLAHGKSLYFDGRVADALLVFEVLGRRLQFGERPGDEPEAEALIYLGEVYASYGRLEDAERAFRLLFERQPEAVINPYHHPPEVVSQFNGTRDQVRLEAAARETPPPPPPRAPWWTLAPLGVGQLGQGQVGRGVAYGLAQGVCGGVSIAVDLQLRRVNGTLGDRRQWPLWDEDFAAKVREIQLIRFGVQWPATFGFYTLWVASVVDARTHWTRAHSGLPAVMFAPRPDGGDLVVAFRW